MKVLHVLAAVAAGLAALAGCGCRQRPLVDESYVRDLEKHRAARVAALTSDSGWLTVTGLHWLEPGANAFGSDPTNPVPLDDPSVPARAGTLDLGPDGAVSLRTAAGEPITVNGSAPPQTPLATDHSGKPDVIGVGRLRMTILARGDRLAVRVRDPQSRARKEFAGIEYFPTEPAWRVEATLERYGVPREVEIPSAQGPAQKMLAPGQLRFRAAGKELSLEPYVTRPDSESLFIVFSDETAGRETYGAGRFLDAALPKPGSSVVILDFNRAYSPPCAFTPHATCPLPPRQNSLAVRVEAGEKTPRGH